MTVLAPVIYIFLFVVFFFTPSLISQDSRERIIAVLLLAL